MGKLHTIIVHGAYGYPDENWFGWMKRELTAGGIPCQVPSFPTPAGQSLSSWLEILNAHTSPLRDANTILIGHSLGAALILRWLELKPVRMKAVILVGAFIGAVGVSQFDTINQDFFAKPFAWPVIREKSQQFIAYHGTNDPYVSRASFEWIAKQLQAEKMIVTSGGHFNRKAGYSQFPQLLAQLKKILE